MPQKENIPDLEKFIKEIEDTIDSLFTPTKEIEIDPLTNEIKEVQRSREEKPSTKKEDKTDLDEEITLELDEDDSVPLETAPPTMPVIEPTIEDIRLEEEEEEKETSTQFESMVHQFNQLYQSLLTLEWEITKEDLTSAYEILKNIAQKIEDLASEDASFLVHSMLDIMRAVKEDPDHACPNAPKALEKGLEALMAIVKDSHPISHETEELIREAKEYMAFVRLEDKPPKERLSTDSWDDKRVVEEICDVPILEEIKEKPFNQERLQAVLNDLAVCIEKIIPVQEVLSHHKKSQKLYKFLANIRSRLEGAIQVLTDELGLDFPEIRLSHTPPEEVIIGEDTEIEPPKNIFPPFKEIQLVTWQGRTIGLIPEEVCYIGHSRSIGQKISGQESIFNLSSLKKWPWSKIRPMLTGELSRLDESVLEAITLPVIKNPDAKEAPESDTPNLSLALLYKDGKGCALIIEGVPQNLNTDDWQWHDETENSLPWIGYLEKEGKKIPVITVEKIFNE
ncbi:hypothetical protein DBT_0064 [Dissulfuribacter thermophilus]|uniref:Uncharacterized protein n=1 Tax=Dissulfuribacter thermophilus TaxID=1156395 RepID=A0A1B9F8I6_9BACT|nr:hypothetical protein [Dissulfuribacter thermophilus]OCC16247.1 hypothetical protein DBT_0064 [Dissulfuribacter thermophilus]